MGGRSAVYTFIPNLIGYARIALAVGAFVVAAHAYVPFFICYALSQILDIFDGQAARRYDQSTRFGAVLDMLTDRMSTLGLLMTLGQMYPSLALVWMALSVLDIVSHWAHMYGSLIRGLGSHKTMADGVHPLLRIYYTNRRVMGALILGNEGFFLGMYLYHFLPGPALAFAGGLHAVPLLLVLCFPLMAGKQLMNGIQLMQAAEDIVRIDDADILQRRSAAPAATAATGS